MKKRGPRHRRDPPGRLVWEIPGIAFSGTTLSYLIDCWRSRRAFSHASHPVCMDLNYLTPFGYAVQRARQYHDNPCILAINLKYLNERPKGKGTLYVSKLNAGSFYPFPAILPRDLRDRDSLDRILVLASYVSLPTSNVITSVDEAVLVYDRALTRAIASRFSS